MLNGMVFLFLGTLGWGISLYLIKLLLVSLTPSEIVLYRMMIGTLTLWILVVCSRLKIPHLGYLLRDGLILGIFNMSLPFYLTVLAEKEVSSSLASVLNSFTPLFTYLIGFTFFNNKKKMDSNIFISILLGLTGVVMINVDCMGSSVNHSSLIALLLTTLSYALAANYVNTIAAAQAPLLLSAMAAFISMSLMLLIKIIDTPALWHLPQNGRQFFSLLWLGGIGSGLGIYLYCFLIGRMGAVIASFITHLMIVTGVLMGVVFLQETLRTMTWWGCVLIVFSLIFMNHAQQGKRWLFEKR